MHGMEIPISSITVVQVANTLASSLVTRHVYEALISPLHVHDKSVKFDLRLLLDPKQHHLSDPAK
jgi:hypothetical protein